MDSKNLLYSGRWWGGREVTRWGTDNSGFPYCPQIFRFSFYQRSQVFQTESVNWWFPTSIATVPWLFRKMKKTLFFLSASSRKKFGKQEALSKKKNMEIIFERTLSPDESESKSVLDSGFHAVDSGFQVLDSTLCQWNLDSWFQYWLGFPILWTVLRIPKPRIPDSSNTIFTDSGIRIPLRYAKSFCS